MVVHGVDFADAIEYSVWGNEASAKWSLANPERHPGEHLVKVGLVPSLGTSSSLVQVSFSDKDSKGRAISVGATFVAVRIGNVVVSGASFVSSPRGTIRFNRPGALSLVVAGVRHLARILQ